MLGWCPPDRSFDSNRSFAACHLFRSAAAATTSSEAGTTGPVRGAGLTHVGTIWMLSITPKVTHTDLDR